MPFQYLVCPMILCSKIELISLAPAPAALMAVVAIPLLATPARFPAFWPWGKIVKFLIEVRLHHEFRLANVVKVMITKLSIYRQD